MAIHLPDDELILDADWAIEWNTTTRTLARYDKLPDGLPYVILAGKKYRPRKACEAWLAKRIQRPNPRRRAA